MKASFGNFQPGFYKRILRLYLPLLLIGVSGLVWFSLRTPPDVQAETVRPTDRVVYTGTFSSSPASRLTSSNSVKPACQPDAGFSLAGPIAPAVDQAGLIEQFDPVYYHLMYGSTGPQLADLSRQCPLVSTGENKPYINAYTSYWIGWSFDYSPGSDGLCRLSDAQVLVHIHQALPAWQNLAQATPQLKTEWQTYLLAVDTHEDGHLQLIRQYSNQLLASLQAFAPTDCGSIVQTVNGLGGNYINQLKQADAAYESSTQSGATQGAIVP